MSSKENKEKWFKRQRRAFHFNAVVQLLFGNKPIGLQMLKTNDSGLKVNEIPRNKIVNVKIKGSLLK